VKRLSAPVSGCRETNGSTVPPSVEQILDSDDDDEFHDAEEEEHEQEQAPAATSNDISADSQPSDQQIETEWKEFQDMIMKQLSAGSDTIGGRFRYKEGARGKHHQSKKQTQSTLSGISAASSAHSHYTSGGIMEPKYPHLQERRYHLFKESWLNFLDATGEMVMHLHRLYSKGDNESFSLGKAVFEDLTGYKTLVDLPEVYQVWVKTLIRAISVTAENVLDDRDWRKKITSIWNKLPLTLIVGSLRIINP
jgi:hypothetical protein